MNVAGIFLAHDDKFGTLKVGLDYSIPEYRDYKSGRFIYQSLNKEFVQSGINKIVAPGLSEKHTKYLKRFGFKEDQQDIYVKTLVDSQKWTS